MKIICFGVRDYEVDIIRRVEKETNREISISSIYIDDSNYNIAEGYDVIIIRANCNLSYDSLRRLKETGLKYLLTRTIGYNHIDIESCKKLGIKVAYAPGYSPASIAELSLSLAFNFLRNISECSLNSLSYNFTLNNRMFGKTISDCTIGIIGCGRIGLETAKKFNQLGANVLGYDIYQKENDFLNFVDLNELLEKSDIISIHMSYDKKINYHFIDYDEFELMKDNVILINTARGELINEKALIKYIENGKILGAGLDVLENEKNIFFKKNKREELSENQKRLINLYPKVVITPHISSSTYNAVYESLIITFNNLNEFVNYGKCRNELI